jgi:hypothetical protein
MKVVRLALVALVSFTLVSWVFAQDKAKPNFSGTWKIDVPATARANGKAARPGEPLTVRVATDNARGVLESFTIEQTDKTLAIKTPNRADIVYTLDNVAHKGEVAQRGGKMEVVIRARWDGQRIITTTLQRTMFEGQLTEIEYKEIRSLDKEGRLNFGLEVSTGNGNYKAIYVKEP